MVRAVHTGRRTNRLEGCDMNRIEVSTRGAQGPGSSPEAQEDTICTYLVLLSLPASQSHRLGSQETNNVFLSFFT